MPSSSRAPVPVRSCVNASCMVSLSASCAPHEGTACCIRWRRAGSLLSRSTRLPLRSARCPCMSPAALSSGTSNQKVAPRPGSDSTPMVPPIKSMIRLQITSPRPVPPYSRVVDASAWANARNRLPMLSLLMPMPESRTSKRSSCWVLFSPLRVTTTVTVPRSVNLSALLIRLVSTWRRRTGSPRTASRTAGSSCRIRRRPLASADFSISWMIELSRSRRLKLVDSSFSLLASSLE